MNLGDVKCDKCWCVFNSFFARFKVCPLCRRGKLLPLTESQPQAETTDRT